MVDLKDSYEVVLDGDPGPDDGIVFSQAQEVRGYRKPPSLSLREDSGVTPVLATTSWGIREALDELTRTDLDLGMIQVKHVDAIRQIRACGAHPMIHGGTLVIEMDEKTNRAALTRVLAQITGNDAIDQERVDEWAA